MKRILFLLALIASAQIYAQVTELKGPLPESIGNIQPQYGNVIVAVDTTTTPWTYYLRDVVGSGGEIVTQVEGTILNPDYSRYTDPETFLEYTNTPVASYYERVNVDGYSIFSWQLTSSGGGYFKIYVSDYDNPSSSNPTSGEWSNYSASFFGADSVLNPSGQMFVQDLPLPVKWVLLQITTTTGTNSSTTRFRKAY